MEKDDLVGVDTTGGPGPEDGGTGPGTPVNLSPEWVLFLPSDFYDRDLLQLGHKGCLMGSL